MEDFPMSSRDSTPSSRMGVLNRYLPEYDVDERHDIVIAATPARVFQALKSVDFADSRLVRVLFRLRGLTRLVSAERRGAGRAFRLETFLRSGFVLLAEQPDEHVVLGFVGRFWALDGDLVRVGPADFTAFHRPGYARAVWGFEIAENGPGRSRLATETRVQVVDAGSRRRFGMYWRLIGPFSGLIRKEMLRVVKGAAE